MLRSYTPKRYTGHIITLFNVARVLGYEGRKFGSMCPFMASHLHIMNNAQLE